MQEKTDTMRLRLAVFDMIGPTVESGGEVSLAFRGAFQKVGVALNDEAVKPCAADRSKTPLPARLEQLPSCPNSVIPGSEAQLPSWLEAVGAWDDD